MIYDCFNFYNEFELLDIRLAELDSIVDKFILAESTVTFTNKKKPLFFAQNKKRYKKYLDKIIHVVIDDSPDVTLPWIIESHQLGNVIRGLPKNCKPNDKILISCVDEIPKAEAILRWKDNPGRHKVMMQKMSYYFLNLVSTTLWGGTMVFDYKELLSYDSPYIARFSPVDLKIPDGGWHLRFMGGIKQIQNKIASWSHQEYNNSEYNTPEYLEKAILQGQDLLKSGLKFKFKNTNFLPRYVLENEDRFTNWLLDYKKYNKLTPIQLKFLDMKMSARIAARKLLSPIRK